MAKGLRAIAKQNVPDEFSQTLTHTRGMLSMGKFEEPNTGTSSFSMLLGDAPFLDRKYTIFGRVVAGDFVLSQLETLETMRDGIFVKPKVRLVQSLTCGSLCTTLTCRIGRLPKQTPPAQTSCAGLP